ncbi:HAD family hydrolase [Zooshikella harenae]|uniref:phosphoglycolate phosphatase n=1 Tax=Zooshikella harenae TaxID=2827238 RepID=A0ABS5ZJ06_9GAMM|nr:HAD family hydrolase [Zooshikella harenae]MBU2712977.1 HAD family hydrolase [Zooshikella harenae]
MTKNAVIFDLDGTLIDTPRAIIETFTQTFLTLGQAAQKAEDIRATIGLPLEKAFSNLLNVPLDDELVIQCIKQYQLLFKEIILPKAKTLLFPGVETGLNVLSDQGLALAIATSKFYTSADLLLKAAGLRDYFSVVVGADQVSCPKPNPESGYLTLKKLGNTSVDNTIMVGDTTHDLQMANSAGMRSIAVTYGIHNLSVLKSSNPTWIADTFADVVNAIAEAFQLKQIEAVIL